MTGARKSQDARVGRLLLFREQHQKPGEAMRMVQTGAETTKRGLAQMLKGGVI